MTKVKFFVDAAAADLSESLVSEYDINLLYPEIAFNRQTYPSDCTWRKTPLKEYIQFIENGGFPKVSQVSMGEWKDEFENVMKDGYDILFLSLSQRFSGGYKNAYTARTLLQRSYPNREFEILDSELGTGGYKLLALKIAAELKSTYEKSTPPLQDFVSSMKKKYSRRVQSYWICRDMDHTVSFSRGTDTFNKELIPEGSPLIATDFKGSFSMVSLNRDIESSFEDLLTRLDDSISAWEFSYSPDMPVDHANRFVKRLTEKLKKAPEHEISLTAPSCVAGTGPYSFSIGILR